MSSAFVFGFDLRAIRHTYIKILRVQIRIKKVLNSSPFLVALQPIRILNIHRRISVSVELAYIASAVIVLLLTAYIRISAEIYSAVAVIKIICVGADNTEQNNFSLTSPKVGIRFSVNQRLRLSFM